MKSAPGTNATQNIGRHTLRARLVIAIAIFLLAFGVRIFSWHDTRLEVGKIQTVVTGDYRRVAQLLRDGGVASFFSRSSPLADLNNLGHPPGYSILIATLSSVFGPSDTALQFTQIIFDALAAVMIGLIVAELVSFGAGVVAGLLGALSPQFAWNSVLLLPDSTSVLPVLLAIYLLALAIKKPRWFIFAAAGVLIGISCWLRANAMLLTFFVAASALLLADRAQSPTNFSLPMVRDKLKFVRQRWQFALAVVCGTLLIVLPLTIRNAIVFRRFIPVSLGAGQTLLEGIADYDREGRFGIPATDMGIMKQEAEIFQRPDYYGTLFNPDGVERERARLRRGFRVISAHPFWFAGVMMKRATSMVRLERARVVSLMPPITHELDKVNRLQPVGSKVPSELMASGTFSPNVKAFPDAGDGTLGLIGSREKYGEQFASGSLRVKPDNDYVFIVPFKLEQGRMRISVVNATGVIYSSTVMETLESTASADQPQHLVALPFVSTNDETVRLSFANEASTAAQPFARIGEVKLFELGPARFVWTRYPRFVVHALQKIFLTAVILPLAILGSGVLIFRKHTKALILLSVVPLYFFTVQSVFHTEYRYVLAVTWFQFAFAGIGLCWVVTCIRSYARRQLHS